MLVNGLQIGSILQVFAAFLKLGLTSFGGPVAHLGYFRDEFVTRRQWLDDKAYGELVTLCQLLPGPASSQVGFAIGVLRGGGLAGGIAAWVAFTLPSAMLLFALALGLTAFSSPGTTGLVHGLKLVAVAVVAQAVLGMGRSLTPDITRLVIAASAVATLLLLPGWPRQVAAIAVGAVAGLLFCRNSGAYRSANLHLPVSRSAGIAALVLFAGLLLAPIGWIQGAQLFSAFYQSGALVFGGGHVVLPLLQTQIVTPGLLDESSFLAGYGLAQAVPGPLFTFAAYLGALIGQPDHSLATASLALIAIFLPGMLLLYGALPFWNRLTDFAMVQAGIRGANAAVVGILAAAFYNPVWTSAILQPLDFALALGGFLLLVVAKAPPWLVVILMAAIGAMQRFL
ncbi:chromate efflux transporter [Aureimonas fodinaquatilis]|uniref:Chromate efflux transporter n=1 Tax=Aureimonas fodinaquatilis TaxID=2565783 RepID=A0A5B0DQ59_9HYPH|nr:chromate efflux transporter [Aureimonas fodinaquatilis]KAA0968588.1 chromate efflux transporter [Aureimonas fodinaquatilis]